MWIETQLKTIIEKAATEFDEAAAKDIELPSAEDGTERGRQLDELLAVQKAKREELWKRLHEVRRLLVQNPCLCAEYRLLR